MIKLEENRELNIYDLRLRDELLNIMQKACKKKTQEVGVDEKLIS